MPSMRLRSRAGRRWSAVVAMFLFSLVARSQAVEINADHAGGIVHPQAGRPSFELAVVRPSAPGAEFRLNGIGMYPNRMEITGTTLKDMIEFAYGVPDDKQFTGGPGWVRMQRFDVTAKPEAADIPALKKLTWTQQHEAMRLRLQVLLEQRFGLEVSFAQKNLPLLVLQQAKGGLRCARVGADNADWFDNPNQPPPPPPEERRVAGHEETMHWTTAGFPFPLIVSWISQQPEVGGRTVVDRTGLNGGFRCELRWSHEDTNPAESSFFTALREQMGLRLQPERGPVEVLIVDRVERPSEN